MLTVDGVLVGALLKAFLLTNSRKEATRFVATVGEALDEFEECAAVVPIKSGQTAEQRVAIVRRAKNRLDLAFRSYVRRTT